MGVAARPVYVVLLFLICMSKVVEWTAGLQDWTGLDFMCE